MVTIINLKLQYTHEHQGTVKICSPYPEFVLTVRINESTLIENTANFRYNEVLGAYKFLRYIRIFVISG